jgi:hypothetical protein
MTKQATEAAPRAAWCHQHHQPRADCLPGDRHVQSFRGADELLDAVKAKAEAMGLNRQDGIEMALEQFVGWHEPGERWRGELAVIAGLPEGDDIYDPRTLKGRRVVIDNAQCDVIGVEVTLGYEPTPSRPYRGSFGLLVRRA